SYSGEAKGMIVGEGENTIPTETITLTGTTTGDKADFLIKVSLGQGMDVDVTFTTDSRSGITGVAAETGATISSDNGSLSVSGINGSVQIYTVDGRLAKAVNVNGEASISIARGIYIVKTANATAKVIVK
ncbi:MAG: T9SS type A sorting domain-containing protein, partial [Muribaculaceae bacterium]|nr:T9SS type A sorting domain-containing protein [Muribaculaceae bacterium]